MKVRIKKVIDGNGLTWYYPQKQVFFLFWVDFKSSIRPICYTYEDAARMFLDHTLASRKRAVIYMEHPTNG